MSTDWLKTFNAFIEDTCVVVTVAWLLTRTRALGAFFEGSTSEKRTVLGLIFGILATSEVIFPGDRSPYVFHTLIVCLAQFVGGAEVTLPAILIVFVTGIALHGVNDAIQTLIMLICVALSVELIRRLWKGTPTTLIVGLAGGLTQGVALLLRNSFLPLIETNPLQPYKMASVFANAFGLCLVMLVWREAQTRVKSEQHRLEAEHVRTLLVAADLAALRARIRPHFLFNTLAAIAALCDIDPKKAQTSVLKVSQLMRRHIEVDSQTLIPLEKELEYVRAYVEVQQLRFGKKAAVEFEIASEYSAISMPAFSLQTLVENAFQHGLERKSGRGLIRIAMRQTRRHTLVAVHDDGAGMKPIELMNCIPDDDPPRHGLAIVDKQLRSVFGGRARLRVFSTLGVGTTVAFQIPAGAEDGGTK